MPHQIVVMYYYFYTFIFTIIIRNCNAQLVLPCEKIDEKQPDSTPPIFPSVFRAELELVNFENIDSNPVYVRLNYDGQNNRVAISFTVSIGSRNIILDYGRGDVTQFDTSKDEGCSINAIENGDYRQELRILFPLLDLNTESEQVFKPELLFGINEGNKTYLGKDNCRASNLFADIDGDIDCEKWGFCHKSEENVTGENVFVYWSAADWKIGNSTKQVFLGYEIMKNTIYSKLVNVMYLSDDLDYSSFQIPEGVICDSNGATAKPLPKIKTEGVWEFQTEAIFNDRRKILNTHTWYDFSNDLGRISYTKNDDTMVTNIADWRSNVVLLKSEKVCKVYEFKMGVFAEIGVQELPITQFGNYMLMFGNDDASKWLYIGKRYVRNLLTDVWQRVRSDWPYLPNNTTYSLWDWHFTTRNSTLGDSQQMIPVYLRIRVLSKSNNVPVYDTNSIIEYHVYGFNFERNSDPFDTSECYSSTEKQHLQFQLDVSDQRFIHKAGAYIQNEFLWDLKIVIAAVAEISFLRIAQIKTVIVKEKLFVQFYLLDKLNSSAIPKEPTLQTARASLSKAIDGNLFIIPGMEIKAVAYTLSDVIKVCRRKRRAEAISFAVDSYVRTSQIHTSDDVLGVAIGSLMSGLAIGAGATLLIAIKKRLA